VVAMDAANCERPPENLDPTARELIRGVYKLNDRLLLILDTERAVEVDYTKAPRSRKNEVVDDEVQGPVQLRSSTKKGTKKASAKRAASTAN
jgi:hypothetical protein